MYVTYDGVSYLEGELCPGMDQTEPVPDPGGEGKVSEGVGETVHPPPTVNKTWLPPQRRVLHVILRVITVINRKSENIYVKYINAESDQTNKS